MMLVVIWLVAYVAVGAMAPAVTALFQLDYGDSALIGLRPPVKPSDDQ